MKPVRLVAEARREFTEAIRRYESERLGLGRRFRLAAQATFERVGSVPAHGKPGVAGTRRMLVKGFPFAIVYVEAEAFVLVHAVAHLSRDASYWLQRLKT